MRINTNRFQFRNPVWKRHSTVIIFRHRERAMSAEDSSASARVVNINIGILGHVDSGKTSLVKALSTSLSTAALDKNPQSQQRGITLDLGFSAFKLPIPAHLTPCDYDQIQFTLVDCPGHASLIRTIIGGAQIIDMIVLVIDANKGIQTQTAECIVISEITTEKLIIVLNKIDMIPEQERSAKLARISERMRKYFSTTKFSDVQIVCTAASVGGEKVASIGAAAGTSTSSTIATDAGVDAEGTSMGVYANTSSVGINDLIHLIQSSVSIPHRQPKAPFYYAIDHCFAIKGHGTVLTGTVLNGSVAVNQVIEIPHIQSQRKVKSMQMFHKSVKYAQQGDRVGLCVTNLDPKLVERGIAAAPETLHQLSSVICMVKKIRFFKNVCKSGSKFHVTVGHSTVLATVVFFGCLEIQTALGETSLSQLSVTDQIHQSTNKPHSSAKVGSSGSNANSASSGSAPALCGAYMHGFPTLPFKSSDEFLAQSELTGSSDLRYGNEPCQWALMQFEQSVFCPLGSLVIGSKLDIDTSASAGGDSNDSVHQCRLAFYGPMRQVITDADIAELRIYNWRSKEGTVFKLADVRAGLCYELIGQNMFSEVSGVQAYLGMRVQAESLREGVITAPFGSDGKFKVKFEVGTRVTVGSALVIRYKRYTYDRTKTMHQSAVSEFAHLPPEEPNTGPEPDKNSNRNKNKKLPVVTSSAPAQLDSAQSFGKPTSTQPPNIPPSMGAPASGKPTDTVVSTPTAKSTGNERRGFIDSLKEETSTDGTTYIIAIIRDAFKMEENIRTYIGSKAARSTETAQAYTGELIGPYAKMGKCKVRFPMNFGGAIGETVIILLEESK